MGWYEKYQSKNKKYANVHDLSKKPRRQVKKDKDYLTTEEKKENIKKWTTFFRRNLHIFVDWYLGVELYFFQIVTLYLMNIHPSFVMIASRGTSKSFMVALYCIATAILKPNSLIVVAAGSKKQANLIIKNKIEKELYRNYPLIAREISKIRFDQGEGEVLFFNGSSIIVVPASDNARGHRSTLNIYEEFRLIDKNILDSIFSPFLISRQAPYLKKDKYKHLLEEPQEIYISSAWYKNGHYMWETVKEHADGMLSDFENSSTGVLAFDYLLTTYHGLKTKKQIEKEKKKLDDVTFMLEYENIMFGESANAFFKYNMFKRNQKIKKAFYPIKNVDFISQKEKTKDPKNKYNIKRQDGEIRIVSVDVSSVGREENDNSVISCARLLPTKDGYERQVCYIESHSGGTNTRQALRIKQIFNDFEGDYIVLDTQTVGLFLYDELGKIIFDEERDIEYPPYIYCKYSEDDEDLKNRTVNTDGLPVIFSLKAYAKLNSNIALEMRNALQKDKIKFLIDFTDAESYLSKTSKEYRDANDVELQNWFEQPYLETTLMINETVNLEYEVKDGNIKVKEVGSARKDRYSSVSYMNYFASILEKELDTEESEYDFVFSYS